MGNRVGSPPSDSDGENEESPDNQPSDADDSDDGMKQTSIADAASTGAAGVAGAATEVVAGTGSSQTPDREETDSELDEYAETVDELRRNPPNSETEPPDSTEEDPDDEPGGEEAVENGLEDQDNLDDDDEEPRFIYGDIVFDREVARQDEVDESEVERSVVVNVPDADASEWKVDQDETVAARHPHYPPTDDVIIIVKRDTLDDRVPAWDEREEEIPLGELSAQDIPYRALPSLRLKLDEPSHLR